MLSSRFNFITLILLSLLGVGIQTQILFGVTDTYIGLRLNLGDFVIPFAGALIVISLFLKQSLWPKWQAPCKDIWFFGLLGVIVMGLVNSYLQYGSISNWAFLNRGIGWGVLTGYIFFAGWCVTNLPEKTILTYLRVFLLFTLGTIILGVVWFLLTQYGTKQIGNANYQALSGFMGNRNAFAFLMLCVVVLYTYFDHQKINVVSKAQPFLTYALWSALPLAMMFNGSRAGWIGVGMIVVLFAITKFKYTLKFIIPAFILSLVVIGGMYMQNPENVFREAQDNKLADLGAKNVIQETDTLRITVAKDALELWSDHRIFGSGIGGFLIFQEEKRGAALDQIDNSALWVLTELGIVGALVFGVFYLIALVALWQTYKTRKNIDKDVYGALAQAMIVVMVLFALFSLVHQILYARYLWFLLGLSLALPKSETINR